MGLGVRGGGGKGCAYAMAGVNIHSGGPFFVGEEGSLVGGDRGKVFVVENVVISFFPDAPKGEDDFLKESGVCIERKKVVGERGGVKEAIKSSFGERMCPNLAGYRAFSEKMVDIFWMTVAQFTGCGGINMAILENFTNW